MSWSVGAECGKNWFKLNFKVLHADGRPDGRVSENNATSGPKSSAEAEMDRVELVSWGRVWQKFKISAHDF